MAKKRFPSSFWPNCAKFGGQSLQESKRRVLFLTPFGKVLAQDAIEVVCILVCLVSVLAVDECVDREYVGRIRVGAAARHVGTVGHTFPTLIFVNVADFQALER